VAAATFSDVPLPGVFRIATDGSVKRVMTLPVQSFPNGLACRKGYLYVSDSSLGAVWRARSTAGSSPSAPWFKNALLKPSMNGLGANGIAFFGNQLFVAASDSGRIVRVPVKTDGSAGTLTVVANLKALRSADGFVPCWTSTKPSVCAPWADAARFCCWKACLKHATWNFARGWSCGTPCIATSRSTCWPATRPRWRSACS